MSTASHGGLKLSRERWAEIPAAVRDAMFTPTFAEEDCEEPIVRTLLGLGDDREREMAVRTGGILRAVRSRAALSPGKGVGHEHDHAA